MPAVHDGVIYQAKWWTQGNDPIHNSGGVGQPSAVVDPSHADILDEPRSGPLEAIARWSLLAAMALGAWPGRSMENPDIEAIIIPICSS